LFSSRLMGVLFVLYSSSSPHGCGEGNKMDLGGG